MRYQSGEEVFHALIQAYDKEKNIEATLSCVTDDIEWVGTEKNERVKGKKELKKLLKTHFRLYQEVEKRMVHDYSVQKLGLQVELFTVAKKLIFENKDLYEIEFRGTVTCVETTNGWLIANIHFSAPSSEVKNLSLQKELLTEREKQTALLENVPGGVAIYRVKKSGRIPTEFVSDGLAHICGFDNAKDIMRIMEYDSRKLVLDEDYPIVANACKNSIEKGIPTSVNYRVHGKDGNPVRVTLDSVVMKNAVLEDDDVAVFYAVQTLVSKEAQKTMEEHKTLSNLFDTVPAGLGICEVKDGKVTHSFMNDAFYRIVRSERKEFKKYIGTDIFAVAHPDDVSKLKEVYQKIMDGAKESEVDYRLKDGKGNFIWLHVTYAVVERREGYLKIYEALYECTESKMQQLELIQNQQAVELAQKQGNLSIWTYNIDQHRIIQQTPVDVEGHLGYPSVVENVPNCFVEEGNIAPNDLKKFLNAYKKIEQGESSVDTVYRIKDQRDGKFNWVHMYYQRMENNTGTDRMAVGFSMVANMQQDAIERYTVEQKLRERMYGDAVMYIEYNLMTNKYEESNNLTDTYKTQQWECPTEQKYMENMKMTVDDPYLDLVISKLYAKNLLKAFENGENKVSCEYRSRPRKDMPPTWYRTNVSMAQRPNTGDVIAFIYIENIEEEKKRQLAIESSMSDGIKNIAVIHVKDRRTRLIQTNSEKPPKDIGEYFVYDDEFVERSHVPVVEEEREFSRDAALLSKVIKELETKDIYQYSVSMEGRDGKITRELFRFRYLDDRKTDIVLSISDITTVYMEEQAKKEQLKVAMEELQKASRAKADFFSRMSHDMRTPMNGILGMTELSEGETDNKVLRGNIRKIKDSGEYLLSLVNDTLDIQRIESGRMTLEPRIVKAKDIVENIVDMVRATAKAKGVYLKYESVNADLSCSIRADALRLKQIFINLLSNAVKFTPVGGMVGLEFRVLSREDMISHSLIYISDTGVGMSEEFLKNGIFQPFSQESNEVSTKYAGSGLGLSIAKSLVELMNGRIEVESKIGVGTTFAVYLDLERVSKEEAAISIQTQKKKSMDISSVLQGKKILLVEDHPLNAEISKKLLQKVGCTVCWAQNGVEAVEAFEKANLYEYDAILMDVRMPVMNGLEATKQIRGLKRKDAKIVPIIAMTANAFDADVKETREAGMNAHLGKPIETKKLYETIVELIER